MRLAIACFAALLVVRPARGNDFEPPLLGPWADSAPTWPGRSLYFDRKGDRVVCRVSDGRSARVEATMTPTGDRIVLTQPGYGRRVEGTLVDGKLRLTGFLMIPGRFPVPVNVAGTYTRVVPIRRDKRSALPAVTGPIKAAGDLKKDLAEFDRIVAASQGRRVDPPKTDPPRTGTSSAEIAAAEASGKPHPAVGVGVIGGTILVVLIGGFLCRKPRPPAPNTTHNPFENDHV
jgi:hypothetical protein